MSDANLRALIDDLEAKQSAAAAAAKGHLGVISAMKDCVSPTTREMLAQHVWSEYTNAVGLDAPIALAPAQISPAVVSTDARPLRRDPDLVRRWLNEVCEPEPYGRGTQAAILHESFVAWCRDQGISDAARPTVTKVGRRLTALGFRPRRGDVGRNYRPLRLKIRPPIG